MTTTTTNPTMNMSGAEKEKIVRALVKESFENDLLQTKELNIRHSEMRKDALEVEVTLLMKNFGDVNHFRFTNGRIMNFLWSLTLKFGLDFEEDDVFMSEKAPEGISKKETIISFQVG